jgi:class 3 adenylate cyclase
MTPITLYQSEESAPPSLTDAVEGDFVRAFRMARRHFVAKLALIAVGAMACISIMMHVMLSGHFRWFGSTEVMVILIAGVLFYIRNRIPRAAFRISASLLVWVQLACSLLTLIDDPTGVPPLAAAMFATSCFTLLYPADRVSLTLMTMVNVGVVFSTYVQHAGNPELPVIYTFFALFTCALRFYFDFAVTGEGRRELRYRLMCAPPHLVLAGGGESFEDAALNFQPESTFCVCLATDWRRYFNMQDQLSASQMAMSLSEFYDLCDRILRVCLPRGNYFADWIADELCVTIYAEGSMSESELVIAAVSFANRLVAAREEFTRMYGLPTELDLGISSGEAVLGIMGPEMHRKATALGEVPGRARRIYGAGRLMRMLLGPADKVILDARTAALLPGDFGQKRIELTAGQSIRDFADREMYVIVPEVDQDGDSSGRDGANRRRSGAA